MTIPPSELALPWSAWAATPIADWALRIRVKGAAVLLTPWTATIINYENGTTHELIPCEKAPHARHAEVGRYEVVRSETCDVFGAVELDRLMARDFEKLLATRKRTKRHLQWSALMAGAVLRREDAPGELSVAEIAHRLGIQVCNIEMRGGGGR